jgi:phosphoribosylanthranilate isomerase
MLMTKVKVGKVTNLSEARYCAGMGVDYLSFPISSVDPKTYQEITGWVSGPKFGLEVSHGDHTSTQEYKTDFIEVRADQMNRLNGDENLVVNLATAGEWLTNKSILHLSKKEILFVELEVSSLDESTVNIIHEIAKDFEVFLKPSIAIDLAEILKLSIAGISLDGDAETKPGLKEYPLAEILEKLEIAD